MAKRGKELSSSERKYLKSLNMIVENWLICKKVDGEWQLVHRLVGRFKNIPAP